MFRSQPRVRLGLSAAVLAAAFLFGQIGAPQASAREERLVDTPAAITTLSTEEIEKLPPITRDLSQIAMLQPGQPVAVAGRYDSIRLRGFPDNGAPGTSLPLGEGTLRDGTDVTRFFVPKTTPPGPIRLDFAPANGDPFTRQAHVYAYLKSWIDQEKLHSFQRAQFGFNLDFGRGPGTVSMVINTTGPIRYAKAGQVQTLRIDRKGKAQLTDCIQALKGSPVGAPFSIIPVFSTLSLASR